MRFTIKYKLFLTLLAATIIVVGSMVLFMKWSFERGFLEYVNTLEQEMHNNLVANLADAYAENGSWDFIRENPRQWREIRRSSIPVAEAAEAREFPPAKADARERKKRAGQGFFSRRHGPPALGKHSRGKSCLLDENREPVTHCRAGDDMQLKEILVNDKRVGYLATSRHKKLSDEHDLHFSQKQHRFLVLLGICIALISVLVALPVSRQLVRPIKVLAEATRKLAAGQYQTRIAVNSSDELGDLSRDFNSLALTLENNEQARQQWIADISHELRTPLSVLRGEIEAIQDGVREVNAERLASLHLQIMNLGRLVNDLYELSMSDIGALNYQKDPVNIATILERCVKGMQDEFADKQIKVTFEPDSADVQIFADGERLQQLFANLLTNALRYTDAGGELRVSTQNLEKTFVVTLEDSAPGVAENDLPRLFERLYRVDNSRNRETGGTGLGLAICKNIVEAHGGSIAAESSALGGLKVIISLPKD